MAPASLITTPTFIIGLGGIGNTVARLIYQRYASTNTRVPETVRIRSIDTAPQPSGLAPELPESMFTRLGDFQANQVIQRLDLYEPVKRWWTYPPNAFAPGFIDNGAGARRPVGRLIFFQQFRKIVDALREDFDGPKSTAVQQAMLDRDLGAVRNTPRVFIIGSVAGGTCSGTFLDMAMLVRHLLRERGYEAQGATVTGIFALPSVVHLASGDATSLQARQRQVNAFSALTELDFLMQGGRPEGGELQYPDPVGRIEMLQPVLNQVYLVSDRKMDGVSFSRQEDVLRRVAHFVYGQVALGMGQKTLELLDNYKRYFDPAGRAVVDGLPAVYGSFGVEWLEVPHEQLIARWCTDVAAELGKQVADFSFGDERRQNLNNVAREALTEGFSGYLRALDLLDATPQDVLSLPGMTDMVPLLAGIQGAANKDDLQRAMQSFETQVPSLFAGLRSAARQLPAGDDAQRWVQATAARLVRDKAFRLGGAKRVLLRLAERLTELNEPAASLESLDEVLKRCGGGWLFGKLDPSPALAWAHDKLLQQARATARAEFGAKALDLAGRLRKQADLLEALQPLLRRAAQELGERTAVTPAADAWLLSEQDILTAIETHRDEVASAVAQAATDAVADRLAQPGAVGDSQVSQQQIAEVFSTAALNALEREAVQRTRRPKDTVQRIVKRLEACEPMAQVLGDGNRLLDVMSRDMVATPLKMVLTEMQGEERQEIERWAERERQLAGGDAAFQVVPSGDALRDDALNLSLGWPLCLFQEVLECERITSISERVDVESSRLLGEFKDARRHTVTPMPAERAQRAFAYAVVLGLAKLVRSDRIILSHELCGIEMEESSVDRAAREFKRRGMNRTVETILRERERDGAAFKADARQRIEALRLRLEGFPADLRSAADQAIVLVERDLQQLAD
ncbi:hypothetical protein TBR22_A06030 [Luteitalea sp. TBR-22]|uniref:tubulin-like doman-containing protein n=1 Tax=Luteitalea sp. TBR-22 TaxID=2802971 RepID=UPI001AF6DF9C|nr:tubulin-like doman-containing protein [Luteitalea sp. TBR-22]BCS31402.1 hypothetical protein TBR22_A06030 [Luteitalea sp. TBR-22]